MRQFFYAQRIIKPQKTQLSIKINNSEIYYFHAAFLAERLNKSKNPAA